MRISYWSSDVCSSDLCLPRPFAELVEQVARGREGAGIGALESEDRLLAVADGEQRADALGIARRHHEKLLRQRQHDAPLAHIGILRLVDQDMVGALVELEEIGRAHV